jgi:hypothetical protein
MFFVVFFEFLSCISSCYRLKVLKFSAGAAGAGHDAMKVVGGKCGGRRIYCFAGGLSRLF